MVVGPSGDPCLCGVAGGKDADAEGLHRGDAWGPLKPTGEDSMFRKDGAGRSACHLSPPCACMSWEVVRCEDMKLVLLDFNGVEGAPR